MPRRRFTEEQIGFALRQVEGGTPVPELCRKLGIAEGRSTAGGSSSRGSASPRFGGSSGSRR